MGKMTFVFEFEDGHEPSVMAGLQFEGGRVVSASWSDYRDDHFSPEQRDIIIGCVDHDEMNEYIDEETAQSIRDKVELMTF